MHRDVLIIGQGICGSFLSHYLEKAGLSYLVIDEERAHTASRAAAGIINPVTGRRIVKTWMIDELLPFAREAYGELGKALGFSCLSPTEIIEFFPTPQMRIAFLERWKEGADYLGMPEEREDDRWREWFHYELGYGSIQSCYLADLSGLIDGTRKKLRAEGRILEERFDTGALSVGESPDGAGHGNGIRMSGAAGNGEGPGTAGTGKDSEIVDAGWVSDRGGTVGKAVRYKDITADYILFCEGAGGFGNPYFRNLPFAPNKGEALVLEIPGLAAAGGGMASEVSEAGPADGMKGMIGPSVTSRERGLVFKKGLVLAPWRDGLFWLGSSYEWSFTDERPTEGFRQKAEASLKEWLKLPYRVQDHIASVRPATIERRPFVGFHPQHPRIGLLNGMGTKGCSLAPYFARQLAGAIAQGTPILKEADISRFERVLKRG